MRTIAYKEREDGGVQGCVRMKKKIFLDHKISKRFSFCAKEFITLPFIIVYRKE